MSEAPALRVAASLSAEEVAQLRSAGLRTLPTSHELRELACWARLTWRPAVRVHALRDLVRSPSALANLSPRAQDMLFAVFRTVNAANRGVCAKFFGVLLLAEDPWLMDTGGPGVDDDALRAEEAFHRLYDARHQYLGNLASSNAELIYRESDALRRQLGQNAPVRVPVSESMLKARRVERRVESTDSIAHPPIPIPVAVTPPSSTVASAMEGVHHHHEDDEHNIHVQHMPPPNVTQHVADNHEDDPTIRSTVDILRDEVNTLKVQLGENERRTKHLQTLFDFMAKVLLDELQISVAMPSEIVTTNRRNGEEGSVSLSPHLTGTKRNSSHNQDDPSAHIGGDNIGTNVSGDPDGDARERRVRLLERFRGVVEAAPWQPYNNGTNGGSGSGTGGDIGVVSGGSGNASHVASAVASGTGAGRDARVEAGMSNGGSSQGHIFRDGKWVER